MSLKGLTLAAPADNTLVTLRVWEEGFSHLPVQIAVGTTRKTLSELLLDVGVRVNSDMLFAIEPTVLGGPVFYNYSGTTEDPLAVSNGSLQLGVKVRGPFDAVEPVKYNSDLGAPWDQGFRFVGSNQSGPGRSNQDVGNASAGVGKTVYIPFGCEDQLILCIPNWRAVQNDTHETYPAANATKTVNGCGIEILAADGTQLATRVFIEAEERNVVIPSGGFGFFTVNMPEGLMASAQWVRIVSHVTMSSGNVLYKQHAFPVQNVAGDWVSTGATNTATGTTFDDTALTDSASTGAAPEVAFVMGRPLSSSSKSVLVIGHSIVADEIYGVGDSPEEDTFWGAAFAGYGKAFVRIGVNGSILNNADPRGDGSFVRWKQTLEMAKGFNESIVYTGQNDFATRTGTQVYNQTVQLENKLKARGHSKVWVCTCGPIGVTSTDQFITTANQTAGSGALQAKRVEFNALVRARGPLNHVDVSAAVSFGGIDGDKWKAGSLVSTHVSTATGSSLNPPRIGIVFGANQRYNRQIGRAIKITNATATNVANLPQYYSVGSSRSTVGGGGTGNTFYLQTTSNFLDAGAAAVSPSAGTTVEIYERYTTDGNHIGAAANNEIETAMVTAGVLVSP